MTFDHYFLFWNQKDFSNWCFCHHVKEWSCPCNINYTSKQRHVKAGGLSISRGRLLHSISHLYKLSCLWRCFFLKIFWCGPFLTNLYWICYNTDSVLMFWFLATRHVGSKLPNQGLNPDPLHWKVKSHALDQQGGPYDNVSTGGSPSLSNYSNTNLLLVTA